MRDYIIKRKGKGKKRIVQRRKEKRKKGKERKEGKRTGRSLYTGEMGPIFLEGYRDPPGDLTEEEEDPDAHQEGEGG